MNIESLSGYTALEFACFANDTLLIDWLISNGAKLETENYSAIHSAAMFSNAEIVEYLLKKGVDPNVITNTGNTPLLVSYECCGDGFGDIITAENRLRTIRLLLAYGADPSLKNNEGISLSDYCKKEKSRSVCDSINIE